LHPTVERKVSITRHGRTPSPTSVEWVQRPQGDMRRDIGLHLLTGRLRSRLRARLGQNKRSHFAVNK
jgi:hypothetical protein